MAISPIPCGYGRHRFIQSIAGVNHGQGATLFQPAPPRALTSWPGVDPLVESVPAAPAQPVSRFRVMVGGIQRDMIDHGLMGQGQGGGIADYRLEASAMILQARRRAASCANDGSISMPNSWACGTRCNRHRAAAPTPHPNSNTS
jgi:hypothetical protein